MAANYDRIFAAIRSKRCLPFLGAGASADYTHDGRIVGGVPVGAHFTSLFNDRCRLKNGARIDDFCLAAERLVFQESGRREELQRIIADAIATIHQPRPIHTALAQLLEIRYAITTNYDTLFETASGAALRTLRVHVHDRTNPRSGATFQDDLDHKPTDLILHKMHGCIRQPSTLLATRSDYIRYLADLPDPNRGMPEDIRKRIISLNTLLFLGYSVRDWNFLVIWEGVLAAHHAAQARLTSYALMRECDDFEEGYLRNLGIDVIKGDLTDFAKALAAEFNLEIPQLGIEKKADASGGGK